MSRLLPSSRGFLVIAAAVALALLLWQGFDTSTTRAANHDAASSGDISSKRASIRPLPVIPSPRSSKSVAEDMGIDVETLEEDGPLGELERPIVELAETRA